MTVVAPEKIPFAQVLGPTIGGALHALHEEHGVRFKLGRKLSEVRGDSVVLDDNSIEPADVVLLAVGVKPDVRLAESAGIETNNGVLVNEYLETSVPRLSAAGDIARYPARFRAGSYMYIEPLVVDLKTGALVGRAPANANVKAISRDGKLLVGTGGGRWDLTNGPLSWVAPDPP